MSVLHAFFEPPLLTPHVRQAAGDVLQVQPPHEAVDEAVALEVVEVALAQVARVVEGPDLENKEHLVSVGIRAAFFCRI